MRKIFLLLVCSFLVTTISFAQETEKEQNEKEKTEQTDEKAEEQKGPSAEELAKSNNPLADIIAFNVQYYHRGSLSQLEGAKASTTWFRFAIPTGRVLWRVSAPFESREIINDETNFATNGLGDLDIFAAYNFIQKPNITFGVGPAASFDTASHEALGTGKNTLGAAAVVYAVASPQFQYGGLVTWRTDVGGDALRDDVNVLAAQPFYFWQAGKGLYFRGAPTMTFNLDNGDYQVPLGLGIGKILKMGGTVFNFFIEAQPTMISRGVGQPNFTTYGALNMQF